MRVNIKDVERNVVDLVKQGQFDYEFIYQLLIAYGKPQSSITRLKKGTYNVASDKKNEIYWQKVILFRYVKDADLHVTIDDLKRSAYAHKYAPRFILVSDFKQLLVVDTKTEETLDIPINELARHFAYFLPWAGMEKSVLITENEADLKAAERMARLYDEIISIDGNDASDSDFYHDLNVFFSRLLFCFFAEDTGVFSDKLFTRSIESYTQSDGSDLNEFLDAVFNAMDEKDKTNHPQHIANFPYVNGGLFSVHKPAPLFSQKARKFILECGELNWSKINPDIFGSMIQAVVHPGQRAGLGMHYTSVVNIMKVIEPLFLEDIRTEHESASGDESKLLKLLDRIYDIKIFDPACGSGNFLIIAYKELRKIEHLILQEIFEIKNKKYVGGNLFNIASGMRLENFYGIEIDDFAREIAVLSLWLAKHQMNQEFKTKFGKDLPLIPLKDMGNVLCANAATYSWNEHCNLGENDEVYIIGNPPFGGARKQTPEQKQDMAIVLGGIKGYKDADYIFIWYKKVAEFIENKAKFKACLVSTNSVCQGQQVSLMWPHILSEKIEIGFAYTSFRWTNNAKHNAGVTCVIICLRNRSNIQKKLFVGQMEIIAKNINAYLADGDELYIYNRTKPLSSLPEINFGSMANDGGNLIFSDNQYKEIVSNYPIVKSYFKKYLGAEDFLRTNYRWCLWLEAEDLYLLSNIKPIMNAMDKTREHRLDSDRAVTKKLAEKPYSFGERRYKPTDSIIVPRVTSERREYLPIGYLNKDFVISDAAFAIYNAEPYIFGLLSSRMHMVWISTVAGRLKTDIRYSAKVVYNNFPVPNLTDQQKKMISNSVFEILDAREQHSEKTLVELYDPNTMPKDLRQAHNDLDQVIDSCYRIRPFESNEDRLSSLLKLYEIMTEIQKEQIHA